MTSFAAGSAATHGSPAGASRQSTVVVVEDDPSMGPAIVRMLRLGGYDPLLFPSAEALLAASPVQAACLVLDVHLPGLSGFELHRVLSQRGAMAPVIFISGQLDSGWRRQAASAAAAASLRKPFSSSALLAAVRRATGA